VGVDGRALGGTVLTLRSVDAARPMATPVSGKIDQVRMQFSPHVLVVPVGSQVTFPNSDTVSHQVYSFSPAKRFELKLYRGKPPEPQLFDRAGVVTLGCNIHDQMRAYIYVVEAQHYGRTDAEGRWTTSQVDPGEYAVTVWHPLSPQQRPVIEQRISIGSGAKLTLRAAAAIKLRGTAQVPANWDAY